MNNKVDSEEKEILLRSITGEVEHIIRESDFLTEEQKQQLIFRFLSNKGGKEFKRVILDRIENYKTELLKRIKLDMIIFHNLQKLKSNEYAGNNN